MQITLDLTKHPVLAKVLAAYGRSQGMSVQDAICENLYNALNLQPECADCLRAKQGRQRS
jgi:hypothetical protein